MHKPTRDRYVLLCLAALLAHSGALFAAAPLDASRQLLDATGTSALLRADAAQASAMIDQSADGMPPLLKSDLRRVIDGDLGYRQLQDAVAASLAAKLDSATIDSNLRWWTSPSGAAVAHAESNIYLSVYRGSEGSQRVADLASDGGSNSTAVERVMTLGMFSEFFGKLLRQSSDARQCLLAAVTFGPDCAQNPAATERAKALAALGKYLDAAARDSYLRLGSGDLSAYGAYLGSGTTAAVLAALRNSVLEEELRSWTSARQETSAAIGSYAQATFGTDVDAALRRATSDIDAGRNLASARISLQLLRRVAPQNPDVFVQLARVTLKQSSSVSYGDGPATVPTVDPRGLDMTQAFLDQALALNANRAYTLMLYGHLEYFRKHFERSLELLEQAKDLGADSPWLRINLGDTLWSLGVHKKDQTMAVRAASEFEDALKGQLPVEAELRAVHQLGDIYAQTGDLAKAKTYHLRYISMNIGRDKAAALHRYGFFLFFDAHDIDQALRVTRQALRIAPDLQLTQQLLVNLLVIKGGMLHAAHDPGAASKYFAEARQLQPDLESLCPDLAFWPAMFIGVFGLHAEGIITDFSGSIGGQTLVKASAFATGRQIEQLLAWGANPNYEDPVSGTALDAAILGSNVAAVKILLAHKANPLRPYLDGRDPRQMASTLREPQRAEILAALDHATGGRAPEVDATGSPLKVGYRYRLRKPFESDSLGYHMQANKIFIYAAPCRYTDDNYVCFMFREPSYGPNQFTYLGLAKDQLTVWTDWFEELGPENDTEHVR